MATFDFSVYLRFFTTTASWGQKRRRGVVGPRNDIGVGGNDLLSVCFLRPSLIFIQLFASPSVESDVFFPAFLYHCTVLDKRVITVGQI
jgi:hypothetical protein